MKNARVIYKRLTEPMKARGYINLNHRLVNTTDDLVEITEIFRNPNYETFRIIYMNGNRIVGHESISSRTPSYAEVFKKDKTGRTNAERCTYKIIERMNRLGANGYYMAHNHTSGSARASDDDMKTTRFFINKINGFLGHLIINGDSYAWISQDKERNDVKAENYIPINHKKVKRMEKKIEENSLDNIKILSREDLVSVLSNIKNSPDYSIAILTDVQGRIRTILDIPNHFLNMDKKQLKGYFQNLGRVTGASRVFFGTDDNETYKKALDHQMNGTFKDCICYKNDKDKIYVYERSDIICEVDLFDNYLRVSEEGEPYMKEKKQVKVLYKKIGEPPEAKVIDDTLEAKQELVGGLIEVVPYEDVLIICNEEGKLLNLPPNLVFDYDYIAGDCFVIGDDYEHGDFKSLTDEEIDKYTKDLNNRSFRYKKRKNKDKERSSKELEGGEEGKITELY